MSKAKKILKWVGGIILLIILGLGVSAWLIHEKLPATENDPQAADELARRMEQAVNKTAWDSTRWVAWRFRTNTSYIWDRRRDMVVVQWDDINVQLHTPSRQGLVFESGQLIDDPERKRALLDKAWSFFANDSFWLCAPMKAFDPGTERDIVLLDNGEKALLVTYNSGGVTPGDQYLWLLDESARPRAWKMWVNILPIGGLEFSWESWVQGKNGVLLATDHQSRLANVPILDLRLEEQIPEIQSGTDPLSALARELAVE